MEKIKTNSKSFAKSALVQTLYPIVVMLAIFGLVFLALYMAL